MIRMAEISNQGGREYNEDSVVLWDDTKRQCVLVADGLGGHGGGKTASQLAVDQMRASGENQSVWDETWIYQMYQQVNQVILDAQTASCKMKTTCVSLYVDKGHALWAHLGDSRLYHFVDGVLVSVTRDHSVSQMAVLSGEISQNQIRHHVDRNKVLRALGVNTEAKPDIAEAALNDGRFHAFLLCTDGFWEYVLEDEMEIDLAKTEEPSAWLSYMVERLRRRARKNHDNYSAAALFYKGDIL